MADGPKHDRRRQPAWTGLATLLILLLLAASAPAADGTLHLTVVDKATGKPIPCRMHLRIGREDGRIRKVRELPFWHDHFVFPGQLTLELPRGTYFFTIERGPEYTWNTGNFVIERNSLGTETAKLVRGVDMAAHGWFAGDLDVRRPLAEMGLLMKAEVVHVAQVPTWGLRDETPGNEPHEETTISLGDRYLCQTAAGEIAHPGGTLAVYGLRERPWLPSGDGEYPALSEIAAAVRDHPEAWIDLADPASWDLPLLVAHGGIDSIRVAHSQLCRDGAEEETRRLKPRNKTRYPGGEGIARWSQDIYFHLLNCGLRLPPSAASGSGEAPNPVGYNRMYVFLDGPFSAEAWWASFREGRVTVGNGPLLQPSVEGRRPGHVFESPDGTPLEFEPILSLTNRGNEPIRYLEVIQDGQVAYSMSFDEYVDRRGRLLPLEFTRSGWFLIRAVAEIPDVYRFAMTGPYYVQIGEQRRVSRRSARFFLDWVYQRARQIRLEDPDQQAETIAAHRHARDFWQGLVDRANAE